MLRPVVLVALVAVGAALGGCSAVAVAVVDSQVSSLTDRECAMSRLLSGDSYCRDAAPVGPPRLYCFKTLGGVDCHETRDPYGVEHSGRALVNPIGQPGAG